jgi:hypothetical protein
MFNSSNILPWIRFSRISQEDYPGKMGIFFIGFLSSALLIAAIGTYYTIFSRKRAFTSRNLAWLGVSLGSILAALGLWVVLLPPEGALAAASALQMLGLIGFETAAFWIVYLASSQDIINKKIFLPSLGARPFCTFPQPGDSPRRCLGGGVYVDFTGTKPLLCFLVPGPETGSFRLYLYGGGGAAHRSGLLYFSSDAADPFPERRAAFFPKPVDVFLPVP